MAWGEHCLTPGREGGGATGRPLLARWEWAFYALLLALALAMRLWHLDARAMHHDESLHAVYSWYLATGKGYQHNPMMHGPFQFHANALVFFLFGDSDFTARLLYALFGTALVALPLALRPWLGRWGAMATSLLLAFSPTLLYFSRFARNDILMAVWTLGLVVGIWRYLSSPRPAYLYLLAGLLALAFATKETAYIHYAILTLYLFYLALPDLKAWLLGRRRLSRFSPAGTLFLVFLTLGLPQWPAILSLFQERWGIVLANKDWTQGVVGLPQGTTAWAVAVGLLGFAWAVSALPGLFWNWRRWPLLAGLFYGLWSMLYTTFFTHGFGVFTGLWQSLGYWVAQQGVRRGAQPWYYYFVITPTYEFLALAFALAGAVYYLRRGGRFERFLVYWNALAFLLYTLAGEKMPWLLVNLALPLALLGGRFLGDLLDRVDWALAWRRGALASWALLALFFPLVVRAFFYQPRRGDLLSFLSLWGLLALVMSLAVLAPYLAFRAGRRSGPALLGLGLAGFLFLFTVRAGWMASYQHGDVPVEMLVYTQTSPDILQVVGEIDRLARSTGEGEDLPIVIDPTDGFSWPWVWYLRHYKRVSYTCYGTAPGCVLSQAPLEAAVVVVNAGNNGAARGVLGQAFTGGRRIRHRWWFPESYRGLTPRAFLSALGDRGAWRRALDYWLYRRFGSPLGSVDAYVYYNREILGRVVP